MSKTSFLKKYKVLSKVGEGSFSEVLKCQERETGVLYAAKRIKKIKQSMDEALSSTEVMFLLKLQTHPHILSIVDKHVDPLPGKMTLIFELMDMSLYDLIKGRKRTLPESRVKTYIHQVLKGLCHMHKNGLFHRDIKPENILLKNDIVKIADLGSVKGTYMKRPYTEYISTRWYRSPECLLTKGIYGPKMDVWATGCVNFELITLRPLFPGSSEVDMIHKIHTVIGTPNSRTMAKFKRLRHRNCEYFFPGRSGSGLCGLLPNISEGGRDLLKQMLVYDPDIRANVRRLLEHRYFNDLRERDEFIQRRSRTVSPIHTPQAVKLPEWRNPLLLNYLASGKRKKSKRTMTNNLSEPMKVPRAPDSSLEQSQLSNGLRPVQPKVPSHIFKQPAMRLKQLERTWGAQGANLPSTANPRRASPSKLVQQTKSPVRPSQTKYEVRTRLSDQAAQKRAVILNHYEKQSKSTRSLDHNLNYDQVMGLVDSDKNMSSGHFSNEEKDKLTNHNINDNVNGKQSGRHLNKVEDKLNDRQLHDVVSHSHAGRHLYEVVRHKSGGCHLNEVGKDKSSNRRLNEAAAHKPSSRHLNEVAKDRPNNRRLNEAAALKPSGRHLNEVAKNKPNDRLLNEAAALKPSGRHLNEVAKDRPSNRRLNEAAAHKPSGRHLNEVAKDRPNNRHFIEIDAHKSSDRHLNQIAKDKPNDRLLNEVAKHQSSRRLLIESKDKTSKRHLNEAAKNKSSGRHLHEIAKDEPSDRHLNEIAKCRESGRHLNKAVELALQENRRVVEIAKGRSLNEVCNNKTNHRNVNEMARCKASGRNLNDAVQLALRENYRVAEIARRRGLLPVLGRNKPQESRWPVVDEDSNGEGRPSGLPTENHTNDFLDLPYEQRLAELAKDLPKQRRSSNLARNISNEIHSSESAKDIQKIECLSELVKGIPKTGPYSPKMIITSPRVLLETLPQTGFLRLPPQVVKKSPEGSGNCNYSSSLPQYVRRTELSKLSLVDVPLATIEETSQTNQRLSQLKSHNR